MVQSLLLLLFHLWSLAAVVLSLHHRSMRLGFAPLMMILGALTALTQGTGSILVNPGGDLKLIVNSNVLIPVLLMAVLVVYVSNGTTAARVLIIGIALVALIVVLTLYLYILYLQLPSTSSFDPFLERTLISNYNPRSTFASMVAFAVDMIAINIFYQVMRNRLPHVPEWLVICFALLLALWTDVIIFNTLTWGGTPFFARLLPGDFVGKSFSALLLAPILALYLTRIAPHLPYFIGGSGRTMFEIVAPSFNDLRFQLVQVQRELHRSENALETTRTEVETERARVQALRDSLSEVSHDLKNPLTSINLRLDMLARTDSREQRTRLVDDTRQLSARMNGMLDDLLTLTRLESDLGGDFVQTDVVALTREIVARIQPQADARGQRLTLDLPDTPLLIPVDLPDFTRALENLIGNAVQYTPEGGQITVRLQAEPAALLFTVSDTGIGIPPDALPHVFDRFYRAPNARLFSSGGTGLGLAIVQKVAQQHGGDLQVSSEVGVGTTITLRLQRPPAARKITAG